MSETKTENTKETKREKFVISNDEPLKFMADGAMKFTTSLEFCKLTNEIFSAVFTDYRGCTFEMSGAGPTMSLYFNHVKTTDDGTYACERAGSKEVGNSIIDKTRARDRQLREGDRYMLTEDGKDVISSLLIPRLYNQGKIDFRKIVTDIFENNGTTYNPSTVQITKVVGIDPRRICALIWGDKDPENDKAKYDYGIDVKSDINRQFGWGGAYNAPNYALVITQANTAVLESTCQKLGFNTNQSSIVLK